ncbi:MAG: hypothetical protein J0I84_07130 [Terrimonas sp.]|nr:hypothetical protein [Terrimonas sp.]
MNFLIVILNRVYFFLTKVKNQSPLFGAVTLVTVLISFSILNIIGLYYAFKIKSVIIVNIPLFLVLNLLIFIPLYFYANKKKALITERIVPYFKTKNLIVVILFLFTVVSTIYLASINRDKISEQTKKEQYEKPRKESLEGKIRKLFE